MKKLLLLLLVLALAVPVFAADHDMLVLTPKLNLGASIYEAWLIPAFQADFMLLPWLGVGGELKGYYGFKFHGMYLAAMAHARLGPFYLGGGASTYLKHGALDATTSTEWDGITYAVMDGQDPNGFVILPALTAGLILPIFKVGPGRLGINTALDWVQTDIPYRWTLSRQADNFLEALILGIVDAAIQGALGVTYGGFKLSVGANYSF